MTNRRQLCGSGLVFADRQELGVGDLVQNSMVDAKQMRRTARYLEKYGLLFNGAISEKENVRDFINGLALFLCRPMNGLFTLIPVFPTDATGEILDQAPLTTFDDYNIIEGSLKALSRCGRASTLPQR